MSTLLDKLKLLKEQLARAYNNKGISLLALGRYEEAKEMFLKAIEYDYQYKYYTNLGIAISEMGEDEEALKIFDLAINGLTEQIENVPTVELDNEEGNKLDFKK